MGTFNNIFLIAICCLATTGLGTYLTFFEQPSEIERLEKIEKVSRLKQTEVATLMAEAALSEDQAAEVMSRWNARYKTIPTMLETHDVIGSLNGMTTSGFRTFDVNYKEATASASFNTHVFDITGRAYFSSLYRLIWELENNQQLYRVRDLDLSHFDLVTSDPETGRSRMDVLVSFSFLLEAYHGGAAGLSAEDQLPDGSGSEVAAIAPRDDVPRVPRSILPDTRPARNPFYPLILSSIPPNADALPEIEDGTLVSIVDSRAVFDLDGELISLGVGDSVYLGQIISVDPLEGKVTARLNKGGIIDEIEIVLETGERFRQALGPVRLAPSERR